MMDTLVLLLLVDLMREQGGCFEHTVQYDTGEDGAGVVRYTGGVGGVATFSLE